MRWRDGKRQKWLTLPLNKPVKIRMLEPADPPFPHARFALELDRLWGLHYRLLGTTRPAVGPIHHIVAGNY